VAPWDGVRAIAARRAAVAVDPVAVVPPPYDRSHTRGIELVSRGRRVPVRRPRGIRFIGDGWRSVTGRGCFGLRNGMVEEERAHRGTRASMGRGTA
jgi:hypothetical protein